MLKIGSKYTSLILQAILSDVIIIIIITRMLAINVSIPNLKIARLVVLTVTIRCMNNKHECSHLAY